MTSLFNDAELNSPQLVVLREAWERRLETLMTQVAKSTLDYSGTQYLRGKIAEANKLLATLEPHKGSTIAGRSRLNPMAGRDKLRLIDE